MHHDWLSSHPFSPIRLRAAQAFTQSQPLCDTGKPLAELERDVQDLMALMEPSYLEEDSLGAESMRRLLYAAGTLIAAAHDGVIRAESRAMESLLGPSGLPKADSVDALRADLPRRLSDVTRHARSSRRLQLIRDLVLIARADGEIHTEELAILHTVTDGLNVDRALLQLALATPGELD